MRIWPTAKAMEHLRRAGIVLIASGKPVRGRGRLSLPSGKKDRRTYALIIRGLAANSHILQNQAIDLDRIEVVNVKNGIQGEAVLSRTKWITEKIRDAGNSRHLSEILERSGISRGRLENELGGELRRALKGVAERTVGKDRKISAEIVQEAAAALIELANLAEKKDDYFIDFIINILIKANIQNHKSSVVHFGAVAFYSAVIAAKAGLSPDSRVFQRLKTAALLHDVGKIALSRELLIKPAPSDSEMRLLYEHLPVTIYLLGGIKWLKNVVPIIRYHHDHDIKKGYPAWIPHGFGRLSPEVQQCVRILQIADAFDGMTSVREYKMGNDRIEGENVVQKKVFKLKDALLCLRAEGRSAEILGVLEKILGDRHRYIHELKKYFRLNELKLVWFGIEHLIKKGVLPCDGLDTDLSSWDQVLLNQRALLWLIGGRDMRCDNAVDFINMIKGEIGEKISREGLTEMYSAIEQLNSPYLGPFIIILYRALVVDADLGSNTFVKLVESARQLSDDPSGFLNLINSFKLAESDYSDQFFRWISLKLCGEDEADVPVYGKKYFVKMVSD